jgi:hypothetical protein
MIFQKGNAANSIVRARNSTCRFTLTKKSASSSRKLPERKTPTCPPWSMTCSKRICGWRKPSNSCKADSEFTSIFSQSPAAMTGKTKSKTKTLRKKKAEKRKPRIPRIFTNISTCRMGS